MAIAEVVVNSPISRGANTFHYKLPPGLPARIGQMVLVPFGPRTLQGLIVDLPDTSLVPEAELRDVKAILGDNPVLSRHHIALACWLSEYYFSSLAEAVRLVLPSGVETRVVPTVELAPGTEVPGDLTPKQQEIVETLRQRGTMREDKLRASVGLGQRGFFGASRGLAKRGILEWGSVLEPPRAGRRIGSAEKHVQITAAGQAAGDAVPRMSAKGQAAVEFLRGQREPVLVRELLAEIGANSGILTTLEKKGLVEITEREVRRETAAYVPYAVSTPPTLTPDQENAWQAIKGELDVAGKLPFLLHGVTGSGKTEVYMRAVDYVLRQGKQAIVLVPEIALTPQAVHRFSSRFPGRVAVWHAQDTDDAPSLPSDSPDSASRIALWHSKLPRGERYDEWHRIRKGEVDVVIGSRSAIFSPLPRLGLIVIDEEHDSSYKQDPIPRYDSRRPAYHTRDVALKLAELTGAMVIMGSATPDVSSYYQALNGRYKLLSLPERVVQGALPPVHVVDMRQELTSGNRSIFSRALTSAMAETLAEGEQIILYLNRRGMATFIMCRDCGLVLRCSRCDVPLVYHLVEDELTCHQCSRRYHVPAVCPKCGSTRIKFFGTGTQKVEAEARRLFPNARVVRWDRDVTKGPAAYEQVLGSFIRHEADILVGTQMIAKGLDLPLVTLVGVVSADTGLFLPDFRAAERTFQLLTQVAGRAGRADRGGRVVVQTYTPDHYCIQAASRHDYTQFYAHERAFRGEHAYPPFGRLVKLVCAHSTEKRCREQTEQMAQILRYETDRQGLPETDIIGPAPAYHCRVRGKYRWQIIVRGGRAQELLRNVALPLGWTVDVDPMSVL